MNIHKNTRLLPYQREVIWQAYHVGKQSVTSLASRYGVSRPTIYKVLKLARVKLLKPQDSTNNRFKQARFGIKRLAKVEKVCKINFSSSQFLIKHVIEPCPYIIDVVYSDNGTKVQRHKRP